MGEKQGRMWDVLYDLDGETVARLLTGWHGLQLLDDGFYEYLVDEGYIEEPEEPEEPDEPEEPEEETNCEAGTYDCDSCPMDGRCDRQVYLQAAIDAETFDDFCSQFIRCIGCPLEHMKGDCEKELWAEVEGGTRQ